MKKIIEGRTYNTQTSRCIGEWNNGYYTNDFAYCSEDLYVNSKGSYFLHGDGGAMSKYAVQSGNSSGGSEQITPMTEPEARAWAEKYLSAEDFEKAFGEQPEAEPSDLTTRERVNLTLDTDIIKKLRLLSEKSSVPMARMVDKAILAMYSSEFDKL